MSDGMAYLLIVIVTLIGAILLTAVYTVAGDVWRSRGNWPLKIMVSCLMAAVFLIFALVISLLLGELG
jgi:uncharacterized membrane protein YdjX (TVP38/TMEM64 family)